MNNLKTKFQTSQEEKIGSFNNSRSILSYSSGIVNLSSVTPWGYQALTKKQRQSLYIKKLIAVCGDSPMTGRIFNKLSSMHFNHLEVVPSQTTLGGWTGCVRETVCRKTTVLSELGFLEKKRRIYRSSIYSLPSWVDNPEMIKRLAQFFSAFRCQLDQVTLLRYSKEIVIDKNKITNEDERMAVQKWKIHLPFHPPNQPQRENTNQTGMSLEKTTKVTKIVVKPEVRPTTNNIMQNSWQEPCIQPKQKPEEFTTRDEERPVASRDSLEQFRAKSPQINEGSIVMLERQQKSEDALRLNADMECKRQVESLINMPETPGMRWLLKACGEDVEYELRKNVIEGIEYRYKKTGQI